MHINKERWMNTIINYCLPTGCRVQVGANANSMSISNPSALNKKILPLLGNERFLSHRFPPKVVLSF